MRSYTDIDRFESELYDNRAKSVADDQNDSLKFLADENVRKAFDYGAFIDRKSKEMQLEEDYYSVPN